MAASEASGDGGGAFPFILYTVRASHPIMCFCSVVGTYPSTNGFNADSRVGNRTRDFAERANIPQGYHTTPSIYSKYLREYFFYI